VPAQLKPKRYPDCSRAGLQGQPLTQFFPDYIYGGSLPSFCQTDGDQLTHAIAKAHVNPEHFARHRLGSDDPGSYAGRPKCGEENNTDLEPALFQASSGRAKAFHLTATTAV